MNRPDDEHDDIAEALKQLIGLLNVLVNDRKESCGAFVDFEPIETGDPIHSAVQGVERTMGQLPMAGWSPWNELLELSRATGGEPGRTRKAYEAADRLLDWAKQHLHKLRHANPPEEPVPEPFLGMVVDIKTRSVAKSGQVIEFENKPAAWRLFIALYDAGSEGSCRNDLSNQVWANDAKSPNALDQLKRKVDSMLLQIGVEVHANNRGQWSLRDGGFTDL